MSRTSCRRRTPTSGERPAAVLVAGTWPEPLVGADVPGGPPPARDVRQSDLVRGAGRARGTRAPTNVGVLMRQGQRGGPCGRPCRGRPAPRAARVRPRQARPSRAAIITRRPRWFDRPPGFWQTFTQVKSRLPKKTMVGAWPDHVVYREGAGRRLAVYREGTGRRLVAEGTSRRRVGHPDFRKEKTCIVSGGTGGGHGCGTGSSPAGRGRAS